MRIDLLLDVAECEWMSDSVESADVVGQLCAALELARLHSLPLSRARALDRLVTILLAQKAYEQAEGYQAELIELLDELVPQDDVVCQTLGHLVLSIAVSQRQPTRAFPYAMRWLPLLRARTGHRASQRAYYFVCAWILGSVGDMEQVRGLALESIDGAPMGDFRREVMRLVLAIDAGDVESIRAEVWNGL